MGLALRPCSACNTGSLRVLPMRCDFRRFPLGGPLSQFTRWRVPQEIARPCLGRTSLRPQAFTTSRRFLPSDASYACFSAVALVGFAPFRGFSSLVADVDTGITESDFLFRGCLHLQTGFPATCLRVFRRWAINRTGV